MEIESIKKPQADGIMEMKKCRNLNRNCEIELPHHNTRDRTRES